MKFRWLLSFLFIIPCLIQAQLQSIDDEGLAQVPGIHKINKKARYGASIISREFNFKPGKGLNKLPIVVASETGDIEMVAAEDKAMVGYLLPYNQFVALKDYDFKIFYKNSFKSQKYPPQKISLTDDDIYLDDSYGELYGFTANTAGQRAKFQYEYEYTDAKYLTRLFFNEPCPVLKSVVSIKVPSWIQLDLQEMNFEGSNIKKEIKKDKDFTIYTYTANNLPMITNEPLGLAKPYYLPHLVITVRSFTIEQKQYNGLKSIDDMYAWYSLLYNKCTNDAGSLKTALATITAGKTGDEEKIKSIYYWVQDNIRYVAFEDGYAGFVPQTAQDVYKNKYGDCKGMANLLTELLKLAGYDAHFSWIGTRSIPYDRKTVQSLCVDNHAICVLYYKGKPYFLDGTEKYAAFGKNAYRIQGKNVLVEFGEKYKTEIVPEAVVADNNIDTKATLKVKDDMLTGHIAITFNGEAKNFFHNIYNNIPLPKRKDFINGMLELNNRNTKVLNVKTSDFKNRDIPILLEADIEVSNQVTKVDNLLYTSIDFFPESISGYVPDEKRQSPIDFDNVFLATDKIVLELPANSKPQSLPQPYTAAFKNSKLDAAYTTEGNNVVLTKKMAFGTPVIYKSDFDTYKKFIAGIKDYNTNNITIKTL